MSDSTKEVVATLLSDPEVRSHISTVNETMRDLHVRMDSFVDRMGTMTAHLENIARESAKTTEVLEQERRDRKIREDHVRQLELRKLDRTDAVEDDNRAKVAKVAHEAWGLFKKPLAYLMTGIFAWFLYTYFGIAS